MRKNLFALVCALTLMTSATFAVEFTSNFIADAATKDLPYTYTITTDTPGATISQDNSLETVTLPTGFTLTANAGAGTATITGSATVTGAWTIHLTTDQGGTQDLFLVVKHPSVDANSPRVGSFTVVPNPISLGATAQCTATSVDDDGDNVAYYWEFGDGGTSRLQNPTHVYAAVGTYTVWLTISDGVKHKSVQQNVVVAEQVQANGTVVVRTSKIQFFFPTNKAANSRVQVTGTVLTPTVLPLLNTVSWTMGSALTRDNAGAGYTITNGAAGDLKNRFTSKVKVTGTTLSNSAFTLDMKSNTLFSELTNLGFLNKFVAGKGEQITVPLSITIGGLAPQNCTYVVTYKAVKNRQGLGQKR